MYSIQVSYLPHRRVLSMEEDGRSDGMGASVGGQKEGTDEEGNKEVTG